MRNKIKASTIATPFQHSTGTPSQSNPAGKINERHPNRKGRGKTIVLCKGLNIIYIKKKNPKDITKKLL